MKILKDWLWLPAKSAVIFWSFGITMKINCKFYRAHGFFLPPLSTDRYTVLQSVALFYKI